MIMTIHLPTHQQDWLKAEVAAGRFRSVEEAAAAAIDAAMADRAAIETDDLEWAAPLVDAARAQVDDGKVMTLDEYRVGIAARLEKLKG